MNRFFFFQGQSVSNVGNAFYEEPISHLLSTVSGFRFHPIHIPFSLIDPKFSPVEFSFLSTNLDLTVSKDDLFVFAGPLGNQLFLRQLFRFLSSKSISNIPNYIFLNFGFTQYDPIEFDLISKIFSIKKPNFVFTRDNFSYSFLSKSFPSLPCESFPDYAFFISKLYQNLQFPVLSPYIASCFDNSKEPKLSSLLHTFEGVSASLNYTKLGKFSRLREVLFTHLNLLSSPQSSISWNNKLIIRPIHSLLPYRPSRIFLKPNAFISEYFVDYLSLYCNTQYTYSDRIHAVVATLSFGNPATLLSRSPRQQLFAFPGLINKSPGQILTLNSSVRDEQWSRLTTLLSQYIADYVG